MEKSCNTSLNCVNFQIPVLLLEKDAINNFIIRFKETYASHTKENLILFINDVIYTLIIFPIIKDLISNEININVDFIDTKDLDSFVTKDNIQKDFLSIIKIHIDEINASIISDINDVISINILNMVIQTIISYVYYVNKYVTKESIVNLTKHIVSKFNDYFKYSSDVSVSSEEQITPMSTPNLSRRQTPQLQSRRNSLLPQINPMPINPMPINPMPINTQLLNQTNSNSTKFPPIKGGKTKRRNTNRKRTNKNKKRNKKK
jgi:hypothetical protein